MNDDRPVGGGMGGKAFQAAAEPEDDFSKLSLDQLLVHGNWKARKSGYEKIAREPMKRRASFFDKVAKVSAESNAAAQESLFDALVALVPVCDDDERSLLCQAPLSLAVEKGITGRPKAVSASQQFASLLVENGKQAEVFDTLLPALSHRTPKNRMSAAQLCAQLVGEFGTQHLPVKSILKAMQPLFSDANPQVRKEGIALCCQCYKYIGAGIKGFLTDLRDVQLHELEKQFETVTLGGTPPKQIKGLASGGGNGKPGGPAAPQAVGSLTGEGASTEVDDAGFELLDESPVIPKLPKKFFPTALDKSTPWQERCDYVTNTLLPLLSAPRLRASDDYHELATMVKIYLTDPQAPLMLLGFQMIQECARGLRGGFSNCAKMYIGPLFDKMKDKKTSVLLHISTTLEKLIQYHCITMDQCGDEMEQVSQSRNPSQRIALVHFCMRMVSKLDGSQYQRLGRSVNMLKRMANDEKSENRDAAYVLLGKLVDTFGEGQYRAVLASMDDKQKARMQIVLAAPSNDASILVSGVPTPKNSAVTPSNSPAKKIPRVEDLSLSSRSATGQAPTPTAAASRRGSSVHGPRTTTGNGSARPSTVHGATHSGRASAKPGMSVTPSLDDPISLESTLPPRMEAANLMLGLLNGDTTVHDLLRSREWSQRLDGVLKVKNTTDQWSAADSTKYYNTLVVYLRSVPGFKESTFQVFLAVLNVLNEVLSKVTSLSPGAGYAIVAGSTPRLTDMKNKQPVRDICSRIGQRLGHRFVIHHMILVVKEVKTPKLMQECNDFFTEVVNKCAESAGPAPQEKPPSHTALPEDRLDVRGMMDYIKRPCFEQTAPPVRVASMRLLLALSAYDNAAVRQWIQTFPPPVIAQFEQQVSASAAGSRRGSDDHSITNGGGGPPLLPRPRPSGLAHTTAPRRASTDADGVQKRHRASSQSPGPGARSRGSVGGAPPTPNRRSQQRVRSPSHRASGTLPGGGGGGSTSSRTPMERSIDAGTPRASEVPSALRPLIREITNGLDWRDRLDAVRKVDDYIDSNNDTLPPGSVAPLLKALGTRFDEANKNFVVDVLRTILRVVEIGGPQESRAPLRRLMPGALAMLGDQKTMLREEARKVVFRGMDVCGLDALLQPLQRPLSSDSNIARQNTLEAMVHGFEHQEPGTSAPVSRAGLQLLVPPVVRALMDRIQEVRLAAEQVIGYVLPITGDEPILRYVQQLKPAEQQAVMPAIERQLSLHTPVNASAALVGPATSTHHGGNEEEEENDDDNANPGRRAGCLSPISMRTSHHSSPPTPVGTPRRAGHMASRRSTVAAGSSAPRTATPSRRGSVTPRTAAAAAGASANGIIHADTNHSASAGNNSAAVPANPPGMTTPSKASARRSSITLQQPQQQQLQTPPPATERVGNAAHVAVTASTTATSSPSASVRGRVDASAAASSRQQQQAAPAPSTPSMVRTQEHKRQPVDKEHAAPFKANEEMYSIPEIQIGLRSATPSVALNMCTDFMKHLRAGEDCGTAEMMQVMVERLYENTQKLEPELAHGLAGCLCAMYMTPRSAQRCHSSLIFRLLGTLFDCLLSEQFSLNEGVLKALNNMTLKMLEGCPPNDVFSALISRMTSYSTTYLQSGRKSDLKYIQVTVKCVMRVDLEQVSSDNVILCCHEYLLQHPPSAFRNLDDLPIRTVKTILQTITRRYGPDLLSTADRLVGPQNLVTHFIRACLENRDRTASAAGTPTAASRAQRENNEKSAVEESIQQQRASQSPAPKATPVRTTTPVRKASTTSTAAGAVSSAATVSPRKSPPTTTTTTHVDPGANLSTPPIVSSAAPTSRVSSGTFVATKTLPPPTDRTKVASATTAAATGTATAAAGGAATPATPSPTPKPSRVPAPTPVATTTAAATAPPTEAPSMGDIFAHIRHHTTSQQGIDELYACLKLSPANCEEEFNHQFLRCSEAFRLYIKRKLDRKVAEDPSPSSNFALPAVLANLPG